MSDNNSTQQQPETAPPLITSSERVRNYLVWGFAISIALHLLGGPFLNNMRFAKGDEKEKVTKVTVSVVVTPKPSPPPTPKPTPPATPPPHATPPPNSTPPPHLKLQPPKTTSQNKSSSSETAYNKPGGAADV